MTSLARQVEALLFLSPEPVSLDDLRDATQQDEPFGEITVRTEAPAPPLRVAAAARRDAVSRTVPS